MVAAFPTGTDDGGKSQRFAPPTVAELAPLFPQLEILELIGKGGMGAVYKARQKQLDRIVALKILPPGIGDDPTFAERFAREAKALAKLNHPNIVTLYEFGNASGQFYFLMEFVDGVNLRQLLHAGRISAREALAIVPQICDALQFAHDQGIVHRDIKPENILLDRRGRVKVADFGLAKIVESREDAANYSATGKISENLTDVGKTMGTPNYMSPEQITAPGEVDHRADIYALGVVFYQMLTGELPGKKIAPPSTKVQIDVRLDEIVLRALEKNPELRYQQVSEVKTGVETIVGSSGRKSAQTESERAQSGQSRFKSAATNEVSRFSRTAIAGAIWCSFGFFIPLLAFVFELKSSLFAKLLMLPFATVPFGTTILGWMAVSQIRRSAGKICGMWLAVFDGLFFPLLALDFLIWYLCIISTLAFRNGSDTSGRIQFAAIALIVSVTISALIDWLIVRAVWRAVNQPLNDGANVSPALTIQKPDLFWRWFIVTTLAMVVVIFLIAVLGLLAAIAIPNFIKARAQAQENARQAADQSNVKNLSASGETMDSQVVRDTADRLIVKNLSASLVGLWSAEGNVIDSVSGIEAVNRNVTYTDGVLGQAFAFDPEKFPYGTYTGIQVADQPAFALTNSLTVQGWIRPRGAGYMIFFRGDNRTGLDPYGLSMEGNNDLRFQICDEQNGTAMVDASIPYNEWTLATAVLDGDTGTMQIYTNGVLAAQTTTTIRPFGRLQPGASPGVGIGNVNDGVNNFPFFGDVDEIALFNRALSAKEIRAVYNVQTSSQKTRIMMPPVTAQKLAEASAETWSPTFAPVEKPDLQKILGDAKDLMNKGDYEAALQRQIWYFNHALEYDQGQTGVRLSFALSQWVELGRRYPRAKQALLEIRDRDTQQLAAGQGYANLFTDMQAINRELQDEDATYALFKIIREKDPQLAGQCYFWVESLLVSKGEYQWCFDHMGDAQSRFDMARRSFDMERASQQRMVEISQRIAQQIADQNQQRGLTNMPAFAPPDTSAMLKKSAEDRFVGQVRQLIEILVATDHKADAEKIRDEAMGVLDDARLKSAVGDAEEKARKKLMEEGLKISNTNAGSITIPLSETNN
jgi:serine/threonine protein kinase